MKEVLTELNLTTKEASIIRKLVAIYKIPDYTIGYALCYYQDIGIQNFKVFCLCLLIALKFNTDYKIRASGWSRNTSIDKSWLIKNEILVLHYFKHQMHLPNQRVICTAIICAAAFIQNKELL